MTTFSYLVLIAGALLTAVVVVALIQSGWGNDGGAA